MKRIKVSIIIATYNSEKTLEEALDSVILQDFQDWECIVIDGKSNDNTIRILENYQKKESRIKYVSEPDKGIYDAFNKGWNIAKGEWVFYLGSDDTMIKDGLSSILKIDSDADVLYGDSVISSYNKKKINVIVSPKPNQLKGKMISHQCMLMKRTLIEKLGGFDISFRICGDFDLFQRAYINGYSFEHRPGGIGCFTSGGTSGKSLRNLKEAYKVRIRNNCCSPLIAKKIYIKGVVLKSFRLYLKAPIAKLYYRFFK